MSSSIPIESLVVLVVEDHRSMRQIIRTVLQSMNVRAVLEAGDGLEALELLNAHNSPIADPTAPAINLVICDWMMPRMTGLELLKEIRTSPLWSLLPFIMVTGETEKEQVVAAVALNVDDYVIKPFQPSLLEQKVRRLMDG